MGSNAIRLQISSVLHTHGKVSFKKVEYVRLPLRIGQDVFRSGHISLKSRQKLLNFLQALKLMMSCYEVDRYMACATAAFREAKNRDVIIAQIQSTLDMPVHLVSGQEEAALIGKAIGHLLKDSTSYLHVDVGGGSTEVSLYTDRRKIATRSFSLGSVRVLEHSDQATEWQALREWITAQKQQLAGPLIGLATGGNIRKLAQIANKKGAKKILSLEKLEDTRKYIAAHSLEERTNELRMNPDRADVIVPAAEIYHAVMSAGGVQEIVVPDVSLRDGIIQSLYEQTCSAVT